ncbi:MAG: O-Antigen ligase [Verrucomicrobia bacterium ADurb.Bin345]|nr:MAG: O-Antigen ligase [Verrucomicrobia bacterium ADurb.Bin345]
MLLAVVLSPWLFGSTEPWAWLLMCLLISFGAAAWLIGVFQDGTLHRVTAVAAVAGSVVLAYVVLQSLPLPPAVARGANRISAETQAAGYHALNEIRASTGLEDVIPAAPPTPSLSVSRAGTVRALYLLIAYLLTFLILVDSIADREDAEVLAWTVASVGFIMALFAIVQDFSGTRLIYWFHRPRLGGTIFGPYTNRNHFAAWMNLCIGVALALLLSSSRYALTPQALPWRERMALLSSRRVNGVILLSYAVVVMASAVFVSLSRGGIASLVAAAGLLSAAVGGRTARVRKRIWMTLFTLWVLAMVAWLGWQPVFERLGSLSILAADPLHDTRWRMTAAVLRMWASAPFFGYGFGAFQHAFPLFQKPVLQFGRFVHGHNDYAQLLAEGGLFGLAAFGFVFALFGMALWRGYRKSSRESQLFVIGLMVGIVSIVLHSAVDFSLRRPANALLLIFMAALALAVTRRNDKDQDYTYNSRTSPRVRAAALLGLAGLALLTLVQTRELRGELAFARFIQWQQIASGGVSTNILIEAAGLGSEEADGMIRGRLMNPDAQMDVVVGTLKNVGRLDIPPDLRIRLAAQAEQAALLSAAAAPTDYEYWLWLSRALRVNGHHEAEELAIAQTAKLAPPGTRME